MESKDAYREVPEELHTEIVRMARKNKMNRKLKVAIIVCVAFLLCVVSSWIVGRVQTKKNVENEIQELKETIQEQENHIQELMETPIVVNPVSPEIVLEIIKSDMGSISELATVEYLFTDASRFTDSRQIKNWNIPFTQKSFLIKWDGVIKAGVDISQLSINVNEKEKILVISMPPAEILSYDIDNDSVEVLDESDNIFNKITIDDKVQFDAKTEQAMKERAIENGILEKAWENSKGIIESLLMANPDVGTTYSVEFTELPTVDN